MAAFMLMASIPDVLMVSGAATFIKHLGYPVYILPFLGVAKVLAVLVIVVPGVPRQTEDVKSRRLWSAYPLRSHLNRVPCRKHPLLPPFQPDDSLVLLTFAQCEPNW